MRKIDRGFLKLFILGLLVPTFLIPVLLSSAAAQTAGVVQNEVEAAGHLQDLVPRVVPTKPAHTEIGPGVYPNLVVVKFVEGSVVRLRQGKLVNFANGSMAPVSDILSKFAGVEIQRLFTRPEADLEAERDRGQTLSGKELADLNNYYLLVLDESVNASELIDALNALDIVEIAYPEPIPEPAEVESPPAPVDIPPVTPNFTGGQGYLNAAPTGVDAQYGWTLRGGRGQGVEVVDIEGGWQIGHEDLDIDAGDLLAGTNSTDPGWRQHGTAVLGEIIGHKNTYGVTGIASRSQAHMVSIFGTTSWPNVSNAINIAASNLNPGDIILIELHALGPSSGEICECNCPQFELIAMEYWQANFDAIQAATANGRIVVEAAGNGSMNLDNAIYGNAFDRSFRDSGAIVVGAATASLPHNPHCWTNYGYRIDSYGWGDSVTTTGYGGLFDGDGDPNQYYTDSFGGTSSASPIVVGAAAVLQGHVRALTGEYLPPHIMREILTGTGTTQGFGGSWGHKHIATLPDLRGATDFLVGKIDFDSVPAPCGFADTTALRRELKPLGASFKGRMEDGGAILDECGNFSVSGHSSPNFLAFNCNATMSDGGIPKLPEQIIFKKSYYPSRVSLRMGSGLTPGMGEKLRAKAKDSAGNWVDKAVVTLAPGLQTANLEGPNIKKVKLVGKNACIAVVDDVYFGECMTGEYTDHLGTIYYLTEDTSGNISGKILGVEPLWIVNGSRQGNSVTLKFTNTGLDTGWCFSYTFTGTTTAGCDSASGSWVNDGGICSGGGPMSFSRSGINAAPVSVKVEDSKDPKAP